MAESLLFADLLGQPLAVDLLAAALRRERLAPAYLFAGPDGVGRRLAAQRFLEGVLTGGETSERERRRLALEKSKKERADQIARHDEREALAKAEQAAKDAERRAVIARERARRAEQNAADIAERDRRAAPRAQPQAAPGKDRAAKRTVEEQLVHDAYVSDAEKAARTAAFVAHQDLSHIEAVARKAKEKADHLKKLQSDMEKEKAAAEHHVPPPQSIASAVSDAMQVS